MSTAIGSTTGAPAPVPAASSGDPIVNPVGGAMGKDQFIKLLVAQMSHQDPLNPMDGQQLASQLAQFSSVEQLMQINQALGAQTASQDAVASAMNSNSAIAALGKTVTALGDQLIVGPGASTSVSYSVGQSGGVGTLKILDGDGHVVSEKDLGKLSAGDHTSDIGDMTGDLPAGNYTYQVDVEDVDGNTVPTQTYVIGRVDGVRYGSSGATLTAGGLSIPFGSILPIDAN
jgi:flagellar basal-body rod modification protein FlgD